MKERRELEIYLVQNFTRVPGNGAEKGSVAVHNNEAELGVAFQ